MSQTEQRPPFAVLSQVRDLLGLDGPLSQLSVDVLRRHTRAQLLECARRLGLTGLSRLTKDVLAARFQEALAKLGDAAGRLAGPSTEVVTGRSARKFDLGPTAERAPAPEHIPWGYGQNRVTAVAVDPDRLYVYWEVTDDVIGAARERLGPGGTEAWLGLRVYDVTGRLFDGT